MLFKNSVRTSKRTLHLTITTINWLMSFKELIPVFVDNHTKQIYSSYSFTTLAVDGNEWSASRPGRALAQRNGPPVLTG
jgi:hypothetical protein